ncbi:MAG: hypothetical protein ABFE07_14785 [Armatimonadia bacterium]
MSRQSLQEHFLGQITAQVEPAPMPSPPTPDLPGMAGKALNYLRGNPDPARDYECKFELGPLGIPVHYPHSVPPNQYAYDPISLADTDCRMDWQYPHMREMVGEREACDVEVGVRTRIMSYMKPDHLAWVNPAAWTGSPIEGLWISKWASANIMISLTDTYARTGEAEARREAQATFRALKALAEWRDRKAFYPGGPVPVKDGEYLTEGWAAAHCKNYPFIVEPCVHYGVTCADQEAVDFAVAMMEGFMAKLQVPDQGDTAFDPETGAFAGHTHLHTRTLWGAAHLGAVLNEPRYLDWAERGYEFVRAHGMDVGWYPEHIPQGRHRAETCITGDMAATALWLAHRHPHYFDHLERIVRNYLRATQFCLTPEFQALFEKLHADKPRAVVEQALAELRKLEGGFVAAPAPDDWVEADQSLGATGRTACGLDMMGCCPPEGMRALWDAWSNTVQERDGAIWINMSLDRVHPVADVCVGPVEGLAAVSMRIRARRAGRYLLRPPAWATEVSLSHGGNLMPLRWGGPDEAYVVCDSVKVGDRLNMTYALPELVQSHALRSVPGKEKAMTLHWRGNDLLAMSPSGTYLPMFGVRR